MLNFFLIPAIMNYKYQFNRNFEMIYLLTIYCLFSIFIGYELYKAPVAWEDEEGFHQK